MSDIPPDEILPCGCILRCSIEDGVNTLTLIRCKADCVNYENAIELAQDKGLPIEYRRGT